jgi:pimeloyl-ACP methyl ester carboxylesterase
VKKKIALGLLAALVVTIGLQVRFDIPAAEVETKYKLPESKFIDINGLRVHYTDEEKTKDKKETIVLIHGTGASLHTWQGWLPELQKSFRVIRMDLPAFGLTGPAPDRNYSIENYVKFLENFFAALGIKQVNLVGNSLGGHIAWRYTAAHPDDVFKLILIDSAGLPRMGDIPLPIRLARKPVFSTVAKYLSPRFLIKRTLKDVYFDPNKVTEDLINRYHTLALRAGNRQAFVDRALQLVEGDGTLLRKIGSPTLILWGRHDRWIPVEQAENFRKKLLLPQTVIYENAGHLPQEELPAESLADALKFLK